MDGEIMPLADVVVGVNYPRGILGVEALQSRIFRLMSSI